MTQSLRNLCNSSDFKRWISSVLLGVMAFSLIGCGLSSTTYTPQESTIISDETNSIKPSEEDSQDTSDSTLSEADVVDQDPVINADNSEDNAGDSPSGLEGLTETQKNSINMLNHLTVLTQEINDSKGSKLFLESAYSSLLNNTYPNAVDQRTQTQLSDILDTLEDYRMITVKRERLEYIYEQNRAQALRQAIPNPIGLLSAVQSGNLLKAAASVLYMAVDSKTSYESYKKQAELEYLENGWELDDQEAAGLHNSRKLAFTYMLSMVRDNDLPGEYALNEESVKSFVDWKNNSNITRKIEFLESNEDTYRAFGDYWLVLAQSYYQANEFEKCLDAIKQYENLSIHIYRKDFNYAEALPMAIISAKEVFEGATYIEQAKDFVSKIMENTNPDNWELRYFAAQIDLDLFALTGNVSFLEHAYEIAVDNINYLVDGQKTLNSAYLNDVIDEPIPKDASADEKKEIKQYNRIQKDIRKTELPPVSEALRLNCELLFALADQLQIPAEEQEKIESILRGSGESLFLVIPLENALKFDDSDEMNDQLCEGITFSGRKLCVPAAYLTDSAQIRVTIESKQDSLVIQDWTIQSVDRTKSAEVKDYIAVLTSKDAKGFKYSDGDTVSVEILPVADEPDYAFECVFSANKVKKAVVFDRIVFERVKQ